MRRELPLFTVLIASFLMVSTASAQETPEFEIETVNGESADQVNEVDLGSSNSIEVGLSGADYENAKFVAYLEGEELLMGDDEEISIRPEHEINEGEQELRVVRQSRREEDISRATIIDITDSGEEDEEKQNETSVGDFEISEVAGEDASKVNSLEVKVGERVDIGLEGADFEQHRFNAFIDGEEVHVDEEGLVISSDIKEIGEGRHELELKYYYRGEGTSRASTQINIEDIEDRRKDDLSTPGEFEIEKLDGEDAGQINEIELVEGDSIDIELKSIDKAEHHFKAFIDGVEFPITDRGLEVTSKISEIEEGRQTLRVASTFRGEEKTDAETQIEVANIESRDERRQPDRLDSELYDENFNPDIEGMKVDRGEGEITITATKESLGSDDAEVVVGDSIEDLTKIELNYARGLGGQGNAVRLKIEEENSGSLESDVKVYGALKVSGKNLELVAPTMQYAVTNKWADKHGFDEAVRSRGGSRENTEIGFYDVEYNWTRFDTRLYDSTETHSIYILQPRTVDQEFSLESRENTIAIGGNPEGGVTYAEGPQGQCESFENSEAVPPGWTELDITCTEIQDIQREKEQLRDRITDLKEDLKTNKGRGEQEDIKKLNNSLEKLEEGDIDEAEKMYEEVQDKTAKSFLRDFIIKTVKDVFPF